MENGKTSQNRDLGLLNIIRIIILFERKKYAHWVQNVLYNSNVSFTVNNKTIEVYARLVDSKESELITNVSNLMNKKYGWSDGLIVELHPQYKY